MLFYNPNIRRRTTYKRQLVFGKPQERKLYSYSIFDNFEIIELVFAEKTTKRFQYNIESKFLDSLREYDEKNELKRKYFFDIINKNECLIEFKESFLKRDNQAGSRGRLIFEKSASLSKCYLSFHRVESFLGYRIKVKIDRNLYGDFIIEEHYCEKNDELQFVLEHEYEYFENELEVTSNKILKFGWEH